MLTPKHKYYNISIGWTTHLTDVAVSPFAGPTPGPAIPVSCDPLELFRAFFDDTLIGLIVTETNRYAKLCLESQDLHATRNGHLPYLNCFRTRTLGFCTFSLFTHQLLHRCCVPLNGSTMRMPVAWFGGIARGFLIPSSTSSCHSEGSIKPCSITCWLRQCGETRRML